MSETNHLSLKKSLDLVLKSATEELNQIQSYEQLMVQKSRFLGKKGPLSELFKTLGRLSFEEKSLQGKEINLIKEELESLFQKKQYELEEQTLHRQLAQTYIDITRPSRSAWQGTLHPLTQTMQQMVEIFTELGFAIATGPEIEHDFYNFEALNFPPAHPAREMQDTFFINEQTLLRTHTSPVQIRTLLKHKPPLRIICPGKVYRKDADVTHSPMFHQIEGLWVDKHTSMADLKGVLQTFAKKMFGEHTRIRLRPSFFPFVEPGAEVDVSCLFCQGHGCRLCKHTGFIEILGAGMVHPHIFKAVSYPKEMRGFAFGMGVERIAMLLYGIDDIRLFFESETRFLGQFVSSLPMTLETESVLDKDVL